MGRPAMLMAVEQRGLSQPAPTGEQIRQQSRPRPHSLRDVSQPLPEVWVPSRQRPSMHRHEGGVRQLAPHVIVGGTVSVLARHMPQQPASAWKAQSLSVAQRPPPAAPPPPPAPALPEVPPLLPSSPLPSELEPVLPQPTARAISRNNESRGNELGTCMVLRLLFTPTRREPRHHRHSCTRRRRFDRHRVEGTSRSGSRGTPPAW